MDYFNTWKSLTPIRDMARRLGFDVGSCHSWDDYSSRFQAANDRNVGHMVKKAKEIAGVLSTGELPVLQAMLHAADFSRQADEISDERTWRRLDHTYGDNATAVALAIMRR
ncbi:hypothetical protein ABID21_002216 [Pseudorhizobium tarimense]|uniref:Uncharacterized protein n=1 Tax=Pseudorhizobium tarimense TaxID=1079109 RepID=A0ABV2H6C4_9HYPH|nr:hypothetical protein [Pseudorhizobium tarimense]MCJ8519076.1 hypothetical protein [Pseudorhizobium tarimense]